MDPLKHYADVVSFIKNVVLEQGMENCNITNIEANEKGEGFMSKIFLITVKDTGSDKQLDVVIKAPIKNNKGEFHPVIHKCFLNEIYFFSKVAPVFEKFGQIKGFLQNTLIPKYYSTHADNNKLVCLENLKVSDFVIMDKLDDEHISFVFKSYGRLHAYSYALRDQRPGQFKELANGFLNLYVEFLDDDTLASADTFRELSKLAYQYLQPGQDDEVIGKFEKYVGDGIVDQFRRVMIEADDSFAITHGDCWSNNIMFQYKGGKNGREPCDLRFIDFQFARLGSPACDLSYFLYSLGCSRDMLDNLDNYLKIYHESFSSWLKKLGSDPEKLFSYDILQEHWKKYARFGMFMSLMMLKVKVTQKEDIKDFSDGLDKAESVKATMESKFDEDTYRQQVRELLHHLSKRDAL